MRNKKAQEFEGGDIMYYLSHPEELERLMDGVIDDELTKGRIRTIYAKIRYGSSSTKELAEYYNIDEKLIKDIAHGKIFRKITMDL